MLGDEVGSNQHTASNLSGNDNMRLHQRSAHARPVAGRHFHLREPVPLDWTARPNFLPLLPTANHL